MWNDSSHVLYYLLSSFIFVFYSKKILFSAAIPLVPVKRKHL